MAFLLTLIIGYLFYRFLSVKIENLLLRIAASYAVSGVIVSFLTISICSDGWVSPSIGTQGACSHHGGVTTSLNGLGIIVFITCIVFLALKFLQKNPINPPKQAISYPQHGYDQTSKLHYIKTATQEHEDLIRKFLNNHNSKIRMHHKYVHEQIISIFLFESEQTQKKVLSLLN